MRPSFSCRGFTLVELLVAISIIAILASLLMPAISVIMEKTRRIACTNNFKQCAVALIVYASENEEMLPKVKANGWSDPDAYYVSGSGFPSLVTQVRPYLGNFKVWRCPTTRAVPVDDPSNSAAILRSSIVYWPYLSYGTSPNAFSSSGNIAQHTSSTALMQDLCYKWSGLWRSNHCRGGSQREVYNNNPSLKTTFDGLPTGINVLYGDGHVAWTNFGNDLVMVYSPGSADTYSDKKVRR